jgi:hypothetical protein
VLCTGVNALVLCTGAVHWCECTGAVHWCECTGVNALVLCTGVNALVLCTGVVHWLWHLGKQRSSILFLSPPPPCVVQGAESHFCFLSPTRICLPQSP